MFGSTSLLYSQQLISAFGGNIESQGSSISFSVGEVVVPTLENEAGAITQGFQQPEIVVVEKLDLSYNNGLIVNGEGSNGLFLLQGIEAYPNNKIVILNRWGEIIFQAQPYLNDWDGTYNNTPLPQATYYFVFSPDQSKKEVVSGNIYVLRN